MDDAYDLQRFVDAQDARGTSARAVEELRAGRKRSHWMWFVLPQLAGLGRSEMAQRYALRELAEARAYLEHPVLGARLRQCARVLLELGETDPVAVFGEVDAQKLRSSMTLFAEAAPDDPLFPAVLQTFFAGRRDEATIRLLRGAAPASSA